MTELHDHNHSPDHSNSSNSDSNSSDHRPNPEPALPANPTSSDEVRQIWRDVMANEAPEDLSDPYMQFTAGVFKNVWARPGLTRKERRLISLTAIATRGSAEALPHHIRAALELGDLTKDELLEWVVHLAHYAGWPASAESYIAVQTAAAQNAQE